MIQIRHSMFETNSSSIHALIVEKEAEGTLGSTIDLSADNPIGDVTRELVRGLDEEDTRKLINWLYCKGVKTIKYNGSNKWINDFAEQYKDSYSDLGLPECIDWDLTDGALINLLIGEYEDYCGSDNVFYYDSDTQISVEI